MEFERPTTMKLATIIEVDGPLLDVAPVQYAAHQAAARTVGWSSLDQGTFWRLMRTKGREAIFLPGARPAKLTEYQTRFTEALETDSVWDPCKCHAGIEAVSKNLGGCCKTFYVTLGSNSGARLAVLRRGRFAGDPLEVLPLSSDPRRRPAELKLLIAGCSHSIVVASSDSLIRAAGSAELLSAGISSGPCTPARLQQAGADVVYDSIAAFAAALAERSPDLIRAGLPPEALI